MPYDMRITRSHGIDIDRIPQSFNCIFRAKIRFFICLCNVSCSLLAGSEHFNKNYAFKEHGEFIQNALIVIRN